MTLRKVIICVIFLFVACKDEEVIRPVISTLPPSEITSASAILKGELLALGNIDIYQYGFLWSKDQKPLVTSDAKFMDNDPKGGFFELRVDNLVPASQYYYRSFIVTSEGIIYGNDVTFKTNETVRLDPIILTTEPYNIKTTSVVLKGQVTSVGTAKINEFGFVWSPTPGVEVSTSNKIILGEMVNPNSFEYLLTDLNQSTQYYFRAFVTTDETTFYGSEISFKTLDFPWRKIANFPGTPRVAAVSFSIGGKGYVGLGYGEGGVTFKDLWEYDPVKNEWTRKSDFKGESRSAAVVFSIGDNAYVGAGAGTGIYDDFWRYSSSTDQWTQIASFPGGAMYYAVAFSISDRGYVGTGIRNGTLLKEFWEYEPVSNSWTRKADYGGQATDVAAAFALGGKGYIGTGNLPLGKSREFWEYDPTLNTWTRKSDMENDRWIGVGFSLENRGYIGLGNGSPNDFWEYNPTTNQWTNVTPFPGGSREAPSAFVIGKKAYVGLGALGYPFPNDFWEYDPNR